MKKWIATGTAPNFGFKTTQKSQVYAAIAAVNPLGATAAQVAAATGIKREERGLLRQRAPQGRVRGGERPDVVAVRGRLAPQPSPLLGRRVVRL